MKLHTCIKQNVSGGQTHSHKKKDIDRCLRLFQHLKHVTIAASVTDLDVVFMFQLLPGCVLWCKRGSMARQRMWIIISLLDLKAFFRVLRIQQPNSYKGTNEWWTRNTRMILSPYHLCTGHVKTHHSHSFWVEHFIRGKGGEISQVGQNIHRSHYRHRDDDGTRKISEEDKHSYFQLRLLAQLNTLQESVQYSLVRFNHFFSNKIQVIPVDRRGNIQKWRRDEPRDFPSPDHKLGSVNSWQVVTHQPP